MALVAVTCSDLQSLRVCKSRAFRPMNAAGAGRWPGVEVKLWRVVRLVGR
jgi:hypothetical protein